MRLFVQRVLSSGFLVTLAENLVGRIKEQNACFDPLLFQAFKAFAQFEKHFSAANVRNNGNFVKLSPRLHTNIHKL